MIINKREQVHTLIPPAATAAGNALNVRFQIWPRYR